MDDVHIFIDDNGPLSLALDESNLSLKAVSFTFELENQDSLDSLSVNLARCHSDLLNLTMELDWSVYPVC